MPCSHVPTEEHRPVIITQDGKGLDEENSFPCSFPEGSLSLFRTPVGVEAESQSFVPNWSEGDSSFCGLSGGWDPESVMEDFMVTEASS